MAEMRKVTQGYIRKNLYRPAKSSHKGQNGRLTIIGGSKLFHGASLWAVKIASRIVDMVYYVSVEENLDLVKDFKKNLYDFIAVPRGREASYIAESDAVLLGPGLVRGEKTFTGTGESGRETKKLVVRLLGAFPTKRWILDAGALQVIEAGELKKLKQVIITPHEKELIELFHLKTQGLKGKTTAQRLKVVQQQASEFSCTVVLKGQVDIVCSAEKCMINQTGNEGMTKGGTGDVLAGLIAALACKNDLFVAAVAGVYINGLAGDKLYEKVGPFFNASDLCEQVPQELKKTMSD